MMPETSSKTKVNQTDKCYQVKPENTGRKRKFNLTSMEEIYRFNRRKRAKLHSLYHDCFFKSFCDSYCRDLKSRDRLVLEEISTWKRAKQTDVSLGKESKTDRCSFSLMSKPTISTSFEEPKSSSKCYIDDLPEELLIKIFSYFPLAMLLQTIPLVCKKWEILALDWTLWKAVEDLTIKKMVISTAKLRTLLRTIPKLKKLELMLRNDTEELLQELFKFHQNLEVLKLDHCYRSPLQRNILSQTLTSVLEFCPKLKIIMLTNTYFRSKKFYKCLAKKFRNIERITVTCTSKSEMDVFMEHLKENVPNVSFQNVPMMGQAEDKQIYWGPILGLVIRPKPTSPFNQHFMRDFFPNYTF